MRERREAINGMILYSFRSISRLKSGGNLRPRRALGNLEQGRVMTGLLLQHIGQGEANGKKGYLNRFESHRAWLSAYQNGRLGVIIFRGMRKTPEEAWGKGAGVKAPSGDFLMRLASVRLSVVYPRTDIPIP